MQNHSDSVIDVDTNMDIAIIGGGIAGLWALNVLQNAGYQCALFEKESLGHAQTLASQGMIHGGIKYALSGGTTAASETIKDMPARWRSYLEGTADIDLSDVKVLSDHYYLFSDSSITSKVTTFFGSKAIEGRVSAVDKNVMPKVFRTDQFKGRVYALQDVVLDTPSLLSSLAKDYRGRIFREDIKLESEDGKNIACLTDGTELNVGIIVLAAGSGNEQLIKQAGLPCHMQRRPLHQVIVKGDLPAIYAHAISLRAADKPRITFTSHQITSSSGSQQTVWYLGGQLAESGVARDETDQIAFAKKELDALFPWLNFSDCEFSTLRIDRAEADTQHKLRPDSPFVEQYGNTIVCWPTKLTLAPMMGDQLVNLVSTAHQSGSNYPPGLPESGTAEVGLAPWESTNDQ